MGVFTSKCAGRGCEVAVVLPRKSSLGEYKRSLPTPLGVYEYDGYEWAGGTAPNFACSVCGSKLPLSEPIPGHAELKNLWKIVVTGPYRDSQQPLEVFYTLQERSRSVDDVRYFARDIVASSEIPLAGIVPELIPYDFD